MGEVFKYPLRTPFCVPQMAVNVNEMNDYAASRVAVVPSPRARHRTSLRHSVKPPRLRRGCVGADTPHACRQTFTDEISRMIASTGRR